MAFVPLHNHSEYSALDGLSTVKEIADRCEQIGCSCCGLSDHGTVAGHLEFAKVMTERGIKPVFACELYHGLKYQGQFAGNERDQAHLVVGALNNEGLRNLWRLVDSTATQDNFRYVPRVRWETLEKYSEGLFATSACVLGLVPRGLVQNDYQALNKYLEIFGDRFYIELHTYPTDDQRDVNLVLAQVATERGIPVVYANDAHYAFPDQYEVHDAYVAAQVGDNIFMDTDSRKMWHPKGLYIQTEEEIRDNLWYLPEQVVDEALANTQAVADSASAELPDVKRHLPVFIPSECPWWFKKEQVAGEMFLDLVQAGITNRYGAKPSDEVLERAFTECEVIINAGLEHYFLQAWDFCQFCDAEDIRRGPGRGSAAGSLVSYCLGITDVDPLHYDLIFERFYNAGREKGFPDIDNDFPKRARKLVKGYMEKRWGEKRVRSIGTISRLKPKAACDKTFKPCGITWDDKEDLKKILDEVPDIEILGPDSIGWSEEVDPGKTIYVMDHVSEQIQEWLDNSVDETHHDIKENWLDILKVVCSRVSNKGVHPSGVVVSDVDLDAELPCTWSRDQEAAVTIFPMDAVDARQFVKQDFLGLRNLDTLEEWEKLIAEREKDFRMEWSGLDLEEYPEEMWKMLDEGLTLGIFQIEDGYARRLCKEFRPRSVEDLAVIVSLNRPGPIRSGAPDSFIARRNGDEPVEYDHPILEDLLEVTYGWFLYQEQVIRFFQKLGYSLSEADAVRKILGKKKPEDMRAVYEGTGDWKGKDYLTMAQAAGVDKDAAQTIWGKIEDFAKYSFNKSHAVSYAVMGFRTMIASYYGSPEYKMACIRTNPDDAGAYVSEARRMGIEVRPPDIYRSDVEIAMHDNEILFGLSNVKNIGKGTAKEIIKIRNRYDVSEGPEALDRALDVLTKEWEQRRDAAKEEGKTFKTRSPRQNVRANVIAALHEAGAWDKYEDRDVSLTDKQKMEKELLGVIVTDNSEEVFAANRDIIDDCDSYNSDESIVTLPGVVTKVDEKRTRKDNKAMGIVTIEFEGDDAEFVVFPQQWKSSKRLLWKERTPGVFTLKKTDRGMNFEKGIKLTL